MLKLSVILLWDFLLRQRPSPHDLLVPFNTNSSVSSDGALWMNDELPQEKVQFLLLKSALLTCLLTLKSRTLPLPRSKLGDRWSLRGTEMPMRCVLDCEIDGQRVVGWLKSRMGRWWSVGMWLGAFTTNCLQAGKLDPAGTARTYSAVSIRKLCAPLYAYMYVHQGHSVDSVNVTAQIFAVFFAFKTT